MRDVSGLHHRAQYHVAPFARAGRMAGGGVGGRRLDDARQRGALGEREVAHVLAEEQVRAFRHAVHGERPTLAEIHVVQVQLEDALLGEAPFEYQRHHLLAHLARVRLVWREERVLDELLRQRAAALEIRLLAAHVRDDRADRADDVDAGMRVETPILDRQHGLHDGARQLRDRHLALTSASARSHGREQRRFELQLRDRTRALDLQLRDLAGLAGLVEGDCHLHGAAFRRAPVRNQPDVGRADVELAGLRRSRLARVTDVVEPVVEFADGECLTHAQHEGPGIDPRGDAVVESGEARIDVFGHAAIEPHEHAGHHQQRTEEHRGGELEPAATASATPRPAGDGHERDRRAFAMRPIRGAGANACHPRRAGSRGDEARAPDRTGSCTTPGRRRVPAGGRRGTRDAGRA